MHSMVYGVDDGEEMHCDHTHGMGIHVCGTFSHVRIHTGVVNFSTRCSHTCGEGMSMFSLVRWNKRCESGQSSIAQHRCFARITKQNA